MPINIWWDQSVNVTVATAYPTYITYNNTVITEVRTETVAVTSVLYGWGGDVQMQGKQYTFDGIPTDIIFNNQEYGGAFSYLAYNTEVTGASGVVITSPTPYYNFENLIRTIGYAITTGPNKATSFNTNGCPAYASPSIFWEGTDLLPGLETISVSPVSIYPSGSIILPAPKYTPQTNNMPLGPVTSILPNAVFSAMIRDLPPANATSYPSWYSAIASCEL